MCDVVVEGQKVKAEAGALLSAIGAEALKYHLKGFAFASGIPGSLGGAVCMNAGAYGGEIKDILLEVEVLTKELETKILSVEELAFSYRHSITALKRRICCYSKRNDRTSRTKKGKTAFKFCKCRKYL